MSPNVGFRHCGSINGFDLVVILLNQTKACSLKEGIFSVSTGFTM